MLSFRSVFLVCCIASSFSASIALAQGPVRTPRVHALTGARIVTAPGRVIEKGTVVLRDGIIEAVGAKVTIPADARVWKVDSLVIYPGLIDLAMPVAPAAAQGAEEGGQGGGRGRAETPKEKPGAFHELEVVTPELVLADRFAMKESDRDGRRNQGILTVRVIPEKGVVRGEAALLNLGDGPLAENLLRRSAGQVLSFAPASGDNYPGSVMGTVAVLRQTILDTRWYADAQAAYAKRPVGLERPTTNAAFEAMLPAVQGKEPIIFVTDDVLDVLRAKELEKEFGLQFAYVGSGEEYKRLDEVGSLPLGIVVPVNFPEPPSVGEPGQSLTISTETLRHWEAAPANLAKVHAARRTFAITAMGLKDVGSFRKNVGKAISQGLPQDAALAATTTVPASMVGLGDRLGTIEPGKIANLVVADGPIFGDSTKVREVWVDGDRYEIEDVKPPKGDPRGTWDMISVYGPEEHAFTLTLTGDIGALSGSIKLGEQEFPVSASQSGSSVTISFPGDVLGMGGTVQFTFTMTGERASGSGTTPQGSFTVTGNRTAKPEGGAR
ncbi:MAG TPA: amidohydrolase family protein [Candidatus Eisenbacteria bacterium]|nr:amidohydrolase family protein [Candidatus Eisenbacteria bacterium]